MATPSLIRHPNKSNELAEFIGIMLGDGHLGKAQIQITLSSLVDKNYASYVMKLGKKLFDCNIKIFKKSDCNALFIYCNSINLARALVESGLKIGSKVKQQVRVPRWILENKDYSKSCCRGLIDTDGCITIHKYVVNKKLYKYKKLIFTNNSVPLAEFVHSTLKDFDLNPKMVVNLEKRRVWLYNSNEVQNYLSIFGTSNEKLLKFRNGG